MKNITVDYKLGVVKMALGDADFGRLLDLAVVDPQLGLVAQMDGNNYPGSPVQGIESIVHIHAAGVLMLKDFRLHWTHSDWEMDEGFDSSRLDELEKQDLEEAVDYLTEHSNRTPMDFEVYNLFDLVVTDGEGRRIEIRF